MAVTRYYSFGGEILGEETGGVRRDYLTDALGSVTATVTGAGAIENTYRYKPYGQQLVKTGTGSDPKFLWNGMWGYRNDRYVYVRTRHYGTTVGRWLSQDPLGFEAGLNLYKSHGNNSVSLIDPSGMQVKKPVLDDIDKKYRCKDHDYCMSCSERPGLPPNDWPSPYVIDAIDKAMKKYCNKCPNLTPRHFMCQLFAEDGPTTGANKGPLQIDKGTWEKYKCEGKYENSVYDEVLSIICAIKAICMKPKDPKNNDYDGFDCHQGKPIRKTGQRGWGTDTLMPHGKYQCCWRCWGKGDFRKPGDGL